MTQQLFSNGEIAKTVTPKQNIHGKTYVRKMVLDLFENVVLDLQLPNGKTIKYKPIVKIEPFKRIRPGYHYYKITFKFGGGVHAVISIDNELNSYDAIASDAVENLGYTGCCYGFRKGKHETNRNSYYFIIRKIIAKITNGEIC